MPTIRLSTSNSVMRSTSRNGVPVRQNPLDGGVVERQRQVHVVRNDYTSAAFARPFSVPETSTPSTASAASRPRSWSLTLFELGREVTSVLDLDELLREDSPADRADDEIHGIRGLSARRGQGRAVDRLLGRLSGRRRADAPAQGRRGSRRSAVAEGRPILVNDVQPIRDMSRQCRARRPSWSCRCGARAASSAR